MRNKFSVAAACTRASVVICLLAGAVFAAPAKPKPLKLYVSTRGNDAWSGRRPRRGVLHRTEGPFRSLARACEEIRQVKAETGLPAGAAVTVRKGTYYPGAALSFGPGDSGTEAGPVVFRAYRNETVWLKGSPLITGWERHSGSIWKANLAGTQLGESRFWQVYYKGERQVLARFPNLDPEHPRTGGFLYVAGVVEKDSKKLLHYDAEQLDPSRWAEPKRVRVHVWSWLNWNRNILHVGAIDADEAVITLAKPASYKLITGNRFFVENALEELDAPGEWFYDEQAKILYFQPPDGKNPEGCISVPVVRDLIHLAGDGKAGKAVSHLQFHGFGLAESQNTLVKMNFALHCALTGLTMEHCGGTALTMSDRCAHNRIAGCDIAHVRGSAIVINGGRDWQHRLEQGCHHNTVTNNHVHHVGEGANAWGAIILGPGCGGNVSHDNVISHNLVHDTPRQGISFNGFRNIVEFNHVHHTNQEQSDTGAIGMGSRDICERGSVVRHNYIHDTGGYNMVKPGVWEYPHYCWGVYLDDYTSGVHVYGNIIVRTYLGGVMVHGGQDNVIENNIIVDGLRQQVQFSPIDHLTRGRNRYHPDKSMWLMTGTKLIGNIFCYRGENSGWLRGKKWEQILAESDRNLVWRPGGPVKMNIKVDEESPDYWSAWQKLGFDKYSVLADPFFVDPGNDDYRLRPESPAFELGFKSIPVEQIGLQKTAERASWPVADDCWREEHVTHPGGNFTKRRKRKDSEIPKLVALKVPKPPLIDGKIGPPEWDWDNRAAQALIQALSMGNGKGRQPSFAVVRYDAECLYVALKNQVSDSASLSTNGGTWGQDDGAEICIQDTSGTKPGPVFVVQGFPSGHCQSVDHAGAPLVAVRKLGKAVRYAASVSDGQWCGEWAIPFAALGVNPKRTDKLLFNIGVLKKSEGQWIAWVSTGGAPWRLEYGGQILLK